MCWPADGKAAPVISNIFLSLSLSPNHPRWQVPIMFAPTHTCTRCTQVGWMCSALAVLLMRNIWFAWAHAKSVRTLRVKRPLIESKLASARARVSNCASRLASARACAYILFQNVIVVHLGVQYLQSHSAWCSICVAAAAVSHYVGQIFVPTRPQPEFKLNRRCIIVVVYILRTW